MIFESLELPEIKRVVHAFVGDIEERALPGKRRGTLERVRGFKYLSSTAMQLFSMSEMTTERSRRSPWSGMQDRLSPLPGLESFVVLNDIERPEDSWLITASQERGVLLVLGDPDPSIKHHVRSPLPEDLDIINDTVERLLADRES